MQNLLINLYLPTLQQYFEIRVPAAMNCMLAAQLAAKAVAPLSNQTYAPSRSSLLAWKENGRLLELGKTMSEAGVKNGSRLILV